MTSLAFIAPAALAVLSLAAIPVLVHMLRRAKSRRLEFPSLRFLRETPSLARALSAPKRRALLALRIAIVALVALAFARPVLSDLGADARAVVILLDASASMRRPEIREAALDRARRAIESLRDGDRVRVGAFTREVRWLGDGDTPQSALAALATFEPGFEAADARRALGEAARYLMARAEPSRSIVVVSDFQRANGPWDASKLDPSIAVEPVRVGDGFDNVFLSSVLIDGSGASQRAQCARVRVSGDDRQVALVGAPIGPGGQSEGVDVAADGDGWRVTAIGADGFDADDTRYVAPADLGAVAVCDPRGAYLGAVASVLVDRDRLTLAPSLDDASLRDAGYALVAQQALAPAGASAALDRWVRAGGHAVVFATAPTGDAFPAPASDPLAAGGLVRESPSVSTDRLDPDLFAESVTGARAIAAEDGDRVLLRSTGGDALAVRRRLGAGVVTVVGLDLSPEHTPLLRHGVFPDLVDWLLRGDGGAEIDVGDRIGGLAPGAKVTDGVGNALTAGADGAVIIRAPGIVRFERDGGPEAVAVNVARSESEPSIVSDDEIVGTLKRDASTAAPASSSLLADAEARQRAWRIVLVAALLLALLELFVVLRGAKPPVVEVHE